LQNLFCILDNIFRRGSFLVRSSLIFQEDFLIKTNPKKRRKKREKKKKKKREKKLLGDVFEKKYKIIKNIYLEKTQTKEKEKEKKTAEKSPESVLPLELQNKK